MTRAHKTEVKYIALAVLTTACAALPSVNFRDWRQVVAFAGAQFLSAVIAAQAFRDQSISQRRNHS